MKRKETNELVKIIQEHNNVNRMANNFMKSITDSDGIYHSVDILLDLYINNNPTPTIYKENVINAFFEDLDSAVDRLKGEYK